MKFDFLKSSLFEKEMTFVQTAEPFRKAVEELCSASKEEAEAACEALLSKMEQIYSDDILLRSYHGYVTFSGPKTYSEFLDATRSVCEGYERLADHGLHPLRCRKESVYLRVMGLGASTRDFKYTMLKKDRQAWDDAIFALEEKILAEDPKYTVPSSELPANQKERLIQYWQRHREEYRLRRTRLDRCRARADLFKKIINGLGIAMLVIPLLFLLVCLVTGNISPELTLMLVCSFIVIGVGVYLFGYLRTRKNRTIKEFEQQGIGQLDRIFSTEEQ